MYTLEDATTENPILTDEEFYEIVKSNFKSIKYPESPESVKYYLYTFNKFKEECIRPSNNHNILSSVLLDNYINWMNFKKFIHNISNVRFAKICEHFKMTCKRTSAGKQYTNIICDNVLNNTIHNNGDTGNYKVDNLLGLVAYGVGNTHLLKNLKFNSESENNNKTICYNSYNMNNNVDKELYTTKINQKHDMITCHSLVISKCSNENFTIGNLIVEYDNDSWEWILPFEMMKIKQQYNKIFIDLNDVPRLLGSKLGKCVNISIEIKSPDTSNFTCECELIVNEFYMDDQGRLIIRKNELIYKEKYYNVIDIKLNELVHMSNGILQGMCQGFYLYDILIDDINNIEIYFCDRKVIEFKKNLIESICKYDCENKKLYIPFGCIINLSRLDVVSIKIDTSNTMSNSHIKLITDTFTFIKYNNTKDIIYDV